MSCYGKQITEVSAGAEGLDMRELYPLYAWKISGTTEAGQEHPGNNTTGEADVSLTFAPSSRTPHLPARLSGPERNCK